jgi:hypothetical protein
MDQSTSVMTSGRATPSGLKKICALTHTFFTRMSALESAASPQSSSANQTFDSVESYVRAMGGKRVIRKVLIANNVRCARPLSLSLSLSLSSPPFSWLSV